MNKILKAVFDYSPIGILKHAIDDNQAASLSKQVELEAERRKNKSIGELAGLPSIQDEEAKRAKIAKLLAAKVEGPVQQPEGPSQMVKTGSGATYEEPVAPVAPSNPTQPFVSQREQYKKSTGLNPDFTLDENKTLHGITGDSGYVNQDTGRPTTADDPRAMRVDAKTAATNARSFAQNDQKLAAGKAEELTPEALSFYGAQFRATGKMNNLGIGGAKTRIAIMNEATRQARVDGQSAEANILEQASRHSSQLELNRLQTIRGPVSAYADRLNKSLDLVESLSNQVDRTGVPIINGWINAGRRSVANDPNISAFDVALRTAANEFGRITSAIGGSSGGQLSDSARHEADQLINALQTPDQLAAAVATLRKDTANATSSLEDQIGQTGGQIVSGTSNFKPTSASKPKNMTEDKVPTAKDFAKSMKNAAAAAKEFPDKIDYIKQKMLKAYPDRADQINRGF